MKTTKTKTKSTSKSDKPKRKRFKKPVKTAKAKTAAKATKTKSKSGYQKGTLSKALQKMFKKAPDISYEDAKKIALAAKPDGVYSKACHWKYRSRFLS